VSKNGILIVQFANHLREMGKDKLDAVIEAAETRLRPILMTTAATVVGHSRWCWRRDQAPGRETASASCW
jgi:multidrug efflux pump subunit AcrB